jgi:hypothetical protein
LTNAQICCQVDPLNPSASDRAVPTGSTCCGANAINTANQVCCSGSVVSNPTNSLQCCGTKGFNPATDLCCGTTDLKVDSKGIVSTVFTQTVVAGAVTQGKQCCGNSAFTPANQLCCPTVADADARAVSSTSATGALSCCGTSTFDPATQTCCSVTTTENFQDADGNTVAVATVTTGVTSGGSSLQCCGTKGVAAGQICCDGTVQSNPNGNLQCCGLSSKTYDPATQTCCSFDTDNYVKVSTDINDCAVYGNEPKHNGNVANIVNGACCDNTPYNSTSSTCCNGRVLPNPNGFECCGTSLFDPANDVCCPDFTVPYAQAFKGKASTNNQCCGTSLFDPTTQACPCGVIIDADNDLVQTNKNPNVNPACCGATQYDGNNKLCCPSGPYLFDLDPAPGLKCCDLDGKTVYNPAYQVCCQKFKFSCPAKPTIPVNTIVAPVPKPATNSPQQDKVQCGDSCCTNGQGYFANYQKCCHDEVLDFNSELDSSTSPMACCGTDVYNVIYESCCVEALNDKNPASVNFKANYAVFGAPGNWQICCKKSL